MHLRRFGVSNPLSPEPTNRAQYRHETSHMLLRGTSEAPCWAFNLGLSILNGLSEFIHPRHGLSNIQLGDTWVSTNAFHATPMIAPW